MKNIFLLPLFMFVGLVYYSWKYKMRIILFILAFGVLYYWYNLPDAQAVPKPAVASAQPAADPTIVDRISQWLVEHAPKQ